MSQEKIAIKDVTPPSGHTSAPNPQTHKGKADRFNPNNRIYVRAVKGIYQQLRRRMGWLLMALFMGLPWIPYGDRQAILLDISQQQFHFFGTTFWPQDLTLLATLFMIAAFALFFITTFLGRVWCGYLCPQTVWTFIYIWFEEKLEGAANKRRKQDSLPQTRHLMVRKTLKHLAWLAVALVTGLTFIGYFLPIHNLIGDFFTLNLGTWPTFWVLFFTACTYANAGWMRTIVCIHMCPYARFQSAMFDKDTYIVGYDTARGEQRGPRSRKQDHHALGLGDCIDCNLCVQVCPTGIDIRDGLQYECINCGACVDACDQTMARMGYETRLLSYTTEHKLEGHQTTILRPKLIGYGTVMGAMIGLFFYLLQAVQPMGLDVLRDRSQLFKINSEGLVENTYTLKILNKTQHAAHYQLSVHGLEDVQWYGDQTISVAAGEVFTLPISLGVDPVVLDSPIAEITFTLLRPSDGHQIHAESRFIGELR
ncbi:cytochrome c oxidase accessory protein CcoG [Photobacterium aphoticum]|uniref:4Fe-4S ferredoxin n=1 Tax=Photobacterium aphoticum TaxID=754436 RepID=A0A0J1JLD4_9GAMM|nr:cytochrome c oxidase accessory protein CcoG [Photobacterium aphoticum]KLV02872.1 4Fe-4S ferredoxin [Photobacterium aphoticum]PSU48699.1 cytochrome c oxidase accessory protein CcoG [Photobacterium aphoticum]GHA62146.1 cytochrome c oxidase accessory protein CcoG [Photobacterium aphoticum]